MSDPSCQTEPARLLYSVAETKRLLSLSHAGFYRLVGAGRLDLRKIGCKSVVPARSIDSFLASLPAAKIGAAA